MSGIFDSGWARRLLDTLGRYGEVEALVTGTTGTTALLDARMEGEIKIIRGRWSAWLREHKGYDIAITATHTVDPERVRAECFHISRIVPDAPLVGIDTCSMTVIPWADGTESFAARLARELGFRTAGPKDYGTTFWREGERECRRVLGVNEGDWILINWIVVGRARSRDILIVKERGRIEIRGAEVKEHGLEKLGDLNLAEAKIDTIVTLRGEVRRRRRVSLKKTNVIAFINHAGYDVYDFLGMNISGAVTVGDDTTAIAGDILSRYGVPVIGITDGDSDGLLPMARYARGSLILRVAKDDNFGRRVFEEIFGNRTSIEGGMKELKRAILEMAKGEGILRGESSES